MEKNLEKQIILKRMDNPVQKSRLNPNEFKLGEYWKVCYQAVVPTEHCRGESQIYRDLIDSVNSTTGNEPKEIIVYF